MMARKKTTDAEVAGIKRRPPTTSACARATRST